MDNERGSVVLITGGAGFLGQHIVRELQVRRSDAVAEIRTLDLKKYRRCLDHPDSIPVVSYVGDVSDADEIDAAFEGVDCVIHCAAHISYQYPPDYRKLENVNVQGTRNVIAACRRHDVPRLVFTSTAEVSFVPYIGPTCLTVIINQTETKAAPPANPRRFLIPGYAHSKHRAEKVALAANGSSTKNGKILKTVALRPSFMYGEGDSHFLTSIIDVAHKWGGRIPKIGGAGGKQQVVYAGNVAWAHLCAMDALAKQDEQISGLPAFITDDTPVEDATRICERLTKVKPQGEALCKTNRWFVPMVVSFAIALLLQGYAALTSKRLPVSPLALVSYLSSFILFSRLRASIHMEYAPAYADEECARRSAAFYTQYYRSLRKKGGNCEDGAIAVK